MSDRFILVTVGEKELLTAERLLKKNSGMALKTLDAIQLAVFVELAEVVTVETFVAFDTALNNVVSSMGIKTLNSATNASARVHGG